MTRIKISLLVPAYNAERYLREALDSVLDSPRDDLQLVVVDDGSVDSTARILSTYNDPRLKVVQQENSGLPEARNAGIQYSDGDYLAFFDADDLYDPASLDALIEGLEATPGAVLSYGRHVRFFRSPDKTIRSPYGHLVNRPSGDVLRTILQANFIGALGACCVPRWAVEKAGPFNRHLTMCEDWEYYCRLAAIGPFVFVPTVTPLLYRQHNASMSASIGTAMAAYETFTDTVFSNPDLVGRIDAPELAWIRRSHMSHLHAYVSLRLLESLRYKDSLMELLTAIRLFPSRTVEFAGRYVWRSLNIALGRNA